MTPCLASERTEKRACARIRPASAAEGRWSKASHPDQYHKERLFRGRSSFLSSGPVLVHQTIKLSCLGLEKFKAMNAPSGVWLRVYSCSI